MRVAHTVAVLVFAGCVTHVPATEVVVVIDAEPSIVHDAQRLHVTVLGGGRGTMLTSQADQMIGSSTAAIRWPVTIALAPAMGDPNRLFALEGDALDSTGATLGVVRARSSYVAGRTLELRLALEDCCRTVATTCTTDQTCRSCACTSADVSASTIPDYAPPDAGVRDAGPPRDFTPRNLPSTVWASAAGTIVVSMSATINTDSGEVLIDGHSSRDFTPLDVPAVGECHPIFAIVTGTFTVAAGATVAVTGSRGLAIAAGTIDIEGTIDIGAHAGTAGAGGLVRHGGGGYGSEGGLPGSCSGASGVIPTFGDPSLAGLCGGTASDAPSSGAGGGALQLAARSLVTVGAAGVIRAVGGGGMSGGGGGSGGGVLVQAPTIRVAGTISVNGGGGGGGGPGADGLAGSAAAAGGVSVRTPGSCGNADSPSGGAGAWQGGGAGNGGVGSYVNCVGNGCISGGGGGGGGGRIRIEADVRDYVAGRVLEYTALSGVFTDGPLSP